MPTKLTSRAHSVDQRFVALQTHGANTFEAVLSDGSGVLPPYTGELGGRAVPTLRIVDPVPRSVVALPTRVLSSLVSGSLRIALTSNASLLVGPLTSAPPDARWAGCSPSLSVPYSGYSLVPLSEEEKCLLLCRVYCVQSVSLLFLALSSLADRFDTKSSSNGRAFLGTRRPAQLHCAQCCCRSSPPIWPWRGRAAC
jgi:hypothetical protein